MIDIGVSHSEVKNLIDLLIAPHTIFIRIRVLDLDHNYLQDISDDFVDGVVSVDASAEISRSLDLTLFDPFTNIHLDPDSPSRTGVYIANMIQVLYVVTNPARTKQYVIPVFTGPIDDVERDDVFLKIKALGKETLSITNAWRGRSFKKGQEKTWVIKQIMTDLIGETKLSLRDKTSKMPNDMKLNRADKPWLVAKKLAKSMGFQLFYDGRGVARMRRIPKNVVHTFDDAWLTSVPQVAYDLSKVINAVEVTGKKPKKGKKRPFARRVADRNHPLSPWRLGRKGAPRYLWVEIEDDSLTSNKECKDRAKEILRDGLLAGIEAKFDGVPFPLLEELDIAHVSNEAAATSFKSRVFTIPLVAGATASYGYLKKAKPRGKPKIKHKGHHRG